jgi:hypothetical protein
MDTQFIEFIRAVLLGVKNCRVAAATPGSYPKGIKVSQAEFATIRLHPDTFHGDWNYSIIPRT